MSGKPLQHYGQHTAVGDLCIISHRCSEAELSDPESCQTKHHRGRSGKPSRIIQECMPKQQFGALL
jgi:hypothetical protein